MEKLLTISIANYNNAKLLNMCLSFLIKPSIIDQLDIIVVNDGSTDNSVEIINEFVNKYPNSISLIDKPNGGYGSTINASLKVAKGKYYKLLDADDTFDINALVSLVVALDKINADIIYTDFNYLNVNNARKKLVNYPYEVNKVLKLKELDEVHMHSMAVKTSLIKDKLEITEHSYYVDIEFAIKCIDICKTFIYLPLPIYYYHIGNNEQSVSKRGYIKHAKEHEEVIKRIMQITYSSPKFNKINDNHINPLAIDQLFIYMFDKKYRDDFYRYRDYLNANYPGLIEKAKRYIRLSAKHKCFYNLFSFLIRIRP